MSKVSIQITSALNGDNSDRFGLIVHRSVKSVYLAPLSSFLTIVLQCFDIVCSVCVIEKDLSALLPR